MKNSLPIVSIIIPTLNEEKNIKKCLDSVFSQNYPKDKLEVIVVDDKSTDDTLAIVKKYPAKILISGAHHGEISKMIGFKKAKGEFAIYLDADVEIGEPEWLNKMLKPLIEDKRIIGSFTGEGARKDSPPLERYLSFDSLQRDTIYQFFSPSVEDVLINKRDGYFICKYELNKIPPTGRCLYRRKQLLELVNNFEMFLELDFLVLLVKNGFDLFAYVPDAKLYHHHVSSLSELVRKRKYNLTKVYLTHVQNRLYTWFELTNPKDIFKIIIWVIYSNLFFPSLLVGIYKTLKYKDFAGMYEPIVNIIITDVLILYFLLDKRTKKLIS